AAPSAAARRNLVTLVLTDDLSERLRVALTALRRASFLEEAMLAMSQAPAGVEHEHRIIGRRVPQPFPPTRAAGARQAQPDPGGARPAARRPPRGGHLLPGDLP